VRFFERQDDGFRVAPGSYAILAQNRSGTFPCPAPTVSPHKRLSLPPTDGLTMLPLDGLEILILPVGRDRAGCNGRSIALGNHTLVVFDRLAIVPLDSAPARASRPTQAVECVTAVAVPGNEGGYGVIRCAEGGYELEGFGCGIDWIDTDTPGAFNIEAEMFDMAYGAIASIFGYGSDAFNAALDNRGFVCDIKSLRRQLAGRVDAEAVSVLARLPRRNSAIARYAPVIP